MSAIWELLNASEDAGCSAKRQRIGVVADAFECLICAQFMIDKIFCCVNGHSICATCYELLRIEPGTCPSCKVKYDYGATRNLAMERLIAGCSLPCKHNCGFMAKPADLNTHQATCILRPVLCPFGEICQHQCAQSQLKSHILAKHMWKSGQAYNLKNMQCVIYSEDQLFITITKDDMRWQNALLLNVGACSVLVYDRKLCDGMWSAQCIHLDQPMKYELSMEAGREHCIYVTGLSKNASDMPSTPNVMLHVGMLDDVYFVEEGKSTMTFTARRIVPVQ